MDKSSDSTETSEKKCLTLVYLKVLIRHPHTSLGYNSPVAFKYSISKSIDANRSVNVEMNVSLTADNLNRSSIINGLVAKRLFEDLILF